MSSLITSTCTLSIVYYTQCNFLMEGDNNNAVMNFKHPIIHPYMVDYQRIDVRYRETIFPMLCTYMLW